MCEATYTASRQSAVETRHTDVKLIAAPESGSPKSVRVMTEEFNSIQPADDISQHNGNILISCQY